MNPHVPAIGQTGGSHSRLSFSKKYVVAAVAAVVIVVLAIVLFGSGKQGNASYKAVVNQFFKSVYMFYEISPYPSTSVVICVDRIDAETLDSLTIEMIDVFLLMMRKQFWIPLRVLLCRVLLQSIRLLTQGLCTRLG